MNCRAAPFGHLRESFKDTQATKKKRKPLAKKIGAKKRLKGGRERWGGSKAYAKTRKLLECVTRGLKRGKVTQKGV